MVKNLDYAVINHKLTVSVLFSVQDTSAVWRAAEERTAHSPLLIPTFSAFSDKLSETTGSLVSHRHRHTRTVTAGRGKTGRLFKFHNKNLRGSSPMCLLCPFSPTAASRFVSIQKFIQSCSGSPRLARMRSPLLNSVRLSALAT